MQSALAARLELEMLDCVGHVDALAVNAGLGEGAVEHLSGRTDERLALQVFLIARLLADKHHRCVRGPFAKDGLGCVLIERATFTARRG